MTQNNKTSLYIHIPFCERKCFYCSFVVAVGQESKIDMYLDCLTKEAMTYQGTQIQSIYIGGGTPSLLDNSQIERLLDMIKKIFCFDAQIEWTMEANPEGLDLQKAKLLKRLGISRVSLGVQSLNNHYLKYLGRNHDRKTAIMTFHRIREAGFDNINLDLMYAFPQQTLAELQQDVEEISNLRSEHLSLYTLTIEKNSRFFTKQVQLDDGESQGEQYMFVIKMLQERGFHQYEISNFSKQSRESLHNINYWQCGNYIGLGVGAHSFLGGKRFSNVTRIEEYIKMVNRENSVVEKCEHLSVPMQFKEAFLFGLRMNEGVNVEELNRKFGYSLQKVEQNQIDDFIKEGFFYRDGAYLRTKLKGRLVLDELCSKLL